jgi:hypothetical protein
MRWNTWRIQSSLRYRHQNVAADALSRLGIPEPPMNEAHFTEHFVQALRVYWWRFPLQQLFLSLMHSWEEAQSTDVAILKRKQQNKSLYSYNPFTGGRLDTRTLGVVLTASKSHPMVPRLPWTSWNLSTEPEETIGQHLWWPKNENQISTQEQSVLSLSQLNKRKDFQEIWTSPRERSWSNSLG